MVLVVAQFLQSTAQLTLVLRADLVSAEGSVEARWSANEDLDVFLLGLRKDSLQKVLGDVALSTSPVLGRVVEEIECLEAPRVGVLQFIEFLLQKDVILRDVTKDKSNLGLVIGVLEDRTDKLVHRSNSSTARDQRDVLMLVGFPGVLGQRTLELEFIANVQVVNVGGHGALVVFLDHKVEMARFIWRDYQHDPTYKKVNALYLHHSQGCMGGGRPFPTQTA